MAKEENLATRCVTGLVRFSYPDVFVAKAINAGDKPKFSCALLIKKTDKEGLARVRTALAAAEVIMKTANNGKLPPKYESPLHDGDVDKPEDDAYAGCYFVNAKSDNKPGLVDANTDPILDKDEFKAGDYGRASINFYYFDVPKSKGIAVGLNNLQKLKDGPALSSRSNAAADFAEAPDFEIPEDLDGEIDDLM